MYKFMWTRKPSGVETKPFFLFTLLLVGSCAGLLQACDKVTPSKPAKRPPAEVSVVIAHASTVALKRELVGRLAATKIAQVRARVAGLILRRVYTEGTDVSQGQILFQIDPAPLTATLHAAQAALARAEADATNAKVSARRKQDLAKKGLLSSQDLDTALANQRTTAAAVKEAQANVEKARLNLGYATVSAPISGYADRALVTVGALVGQGQATKLTTIEQIDPIYVNFSLPAGERQQLRQGQLRQNQLQQGNKDKPAQNTAYSIDKVTIKLADGTAYSHPGRVDFSALSVDPQTGTFSLRARVPNPEHRLLPGMFVNLAVTMGQLDDAFSLPQATVLRDKKGAYVLVVDTAGKVEQRRVQTHGMTKTNWIVSGNLTEGDQVILAGLQKVKPGTQAKAVPVVVADVDTPAAKSAANR